MSGIGAGFLAIAGVWLMLWGFEHHGAEALIACLLGGGLIGTAMTAAFQ